VSARALACALLASLALILVEPALASWEGVSLSGGVLLVFLSIASAPRSAVLDAPWRTGLSSASAALPALGLAIGLDLARGVPSGRLVVASAAASAIVALWSFAASLASSTGRARSLFAALWIAALPGSAVLWAALAWAPAGRGATTAPGASLAGANALVWLHRWTRVGGLSTVEPASAAAPLVLALLALVAVLVARRPAESSASR
jgi:hypothetical protein